jgi:hypothetical protein
LNISKVSRLDKSISIFQADFVTMMSDQINLSRAIEITKISTVDESK